jgi:transcriptional regulator with XRE-family HTH domain
MAKLKWMRALIYGQYDSEAAFAQHLGWSRQRLDKIVRGVRDPDLNDLNVLAPALNVSVGDLAEKFLSK